MTDKKDEALLVAVDDGYAQMKLYGDAPSGKGKPKTAVMKSAIAVGRRGLGTIDGAEAIEAWETEEGQAFTVSADIATEGTKFDSFHFSEINRVLVNHSLYAAGYGGKKVALVAGLPVADYFSHGMRNEESIARKTANLMKKAKLTSSAEPSAEIVSVRVGCQAVAAYVDWLLDDDLKETKPANSRVAIVDIGGRTTDIAVVYGGRQIDHDRSGTADIGVLDVYQAVERQIQGKFSVKDKFPIAFLERVVREHKARLFGKDEDVAELVRIALAEQEAKIKLECERQLQAAATLDAVIFVGGGAALFPNLPAQFRNGVLSKDPEIANARGMWKFFRFKAMKEEEKSKPAADKPAADKPAAAAE